jgi:hypothetical protein
MSMKSRANLAQKEVAPDTLGKPKSSQQQFKLIKIRTDLYFHLLDLKERRRGRCSFSRVISELLDCYTKTKEGRQLGF